MVRKAVLLVGFSNWGKTTHINGLFGRSKFYYGVTYAIPTVNATFTVESHSNDDWSQTTFLRGIAGRIARSPDNGENIFGTLCPSREPQSNSNRILSELPFSA